MLAVKKLIRALGRIAREREIWPVALLLFAVVVPAVCLVWFTAAAMRNERLAARQKVSEAYLGQLIQAQARWDRAWEELQLNVMRAAASNPPATAFAKIVLSSNASSVILFDEKQRMVYPDKPAPPVAKSFSDAEASQLEHVAKDYAGAADRYHALGLAADDADVAARAFQAEARCLAKAGRKDAAIRVVEEVLGQDRFLGAADPQGRLIVANAELFALELGAGDLIARRLKERLLDYRLSVMAAPQRLFLMRELKALRPEIDFPTFAAEALAAEVSEQRLPMQAIMERIPVTDIWHCASWCGRALIIVRSDHFAALIRAAAGNGILALPPPVDDLGSVTYPLGSHFPGWRLALPVWKEPQSNTTTIYLWTVLLVLVSVAVLTWLALRVVRRQMALARLKNDLVATASHELKTPLSSMRLLVETLLDAKNLDEQSTREYLQLIARENARLSRLTEKFLAFSRLEREKNVLQVKRVPVRPIIDAAVRGRGIEVQTAPDLPEIMADPDALAAALTNLVENACKYSEHSDLIVVRGAARNGSVVLSVEDRGVGLEPREVKKIFEPFYQVDQTLSRKGGGCGLGLSIVDSIVKAHGGKVTVESQPGRGSTFSIILPKAT